MTENKFKAPIIKLLRDQGAMVYPLIAGERAPAGWPDNLVVHRKWTGLIEFKARTTAITKLQLRTIYDLNLRQPGYAVIARETSEKYVLRVSAVSIIGLANGTTTPITETGFVDWEELLEELRLWRLKKTGGNSGV